MAVKAERPSQERTSKTTPKKTSFSFWFQVWREAFFDFAENTKINGMYYIRRGVTEGFLRLFWATLMLTLFCFALILIYLLWSVYLNSPTRVTIHSPLRIDQIPFPAITVCHPQSVIDYQVEEFIKYVKFPKYATEQRVKESLLALGVFTELQWSEPDYRSLKLVDELLEINNMTIKDGIDTLGTTCNDFLLQCYWAGKEFPCFQEHPYLRWINSTSHLGACCSFNYHPGLSDHVSNGIDQDKLFMANTFGSDGGLSVIFTGAPEVADGRSGVLYSEGFVLNVHHPLDFSVEAMPLALLGTGTEIFVAVTATHSSCSDQVLALPVSQRKCLVPADLGKTFYRQPACSLGCLRDAVHDKCHCHPYHLPRSEVPNLRNCSVFDAHCFMSNYYYFKTLPCDCLPSCQDVTYKMSSFSIPLGEHPFGTNPLYKKVNSTKFEFMAHIYYANQLVASNRKIVVMSWISLLANLGGAFNLCLGMSVLSIIEIFYILFYGIYKYYRRCLDEGPEDNTKQSKLQIFK